MHAAACSCRCPWRKTYYRNTFKETQDSRNHRKIWYDPEYFYWLLCVVSAEVVWLLLSSAGEDQPMTFDVSFFCSSKQSSIQCWSETTWTTWTVSRVWWWVLVFVQTVVYCKQYVTKIERNVFCLYVCSTVAVYGLFVFQNNKGASLLVLFNLAVLGRSVFKTPKGTKTPGFVAKKHPLWMSGSLLNVFQASEAMRASPEYYWMVFRKSFAFLVLAPMQLHVAWPSK